MGAAMEFKKPLPEEEQIKLFEELKKNDDPIIREKLILHNLRLVQWVALKYYKPGKNELNDLFQQGVLGLMEAIEQYDPEKGTFANYAIWWIKNYSIKGLDAERLIRIPIYLKEKVNSVIKVRNNLIQKLGREPTEYDVSKATGLGLEDTRKLLNIINKPISLNTPIGEEGEGLTLEDTIPDDRYNLEEIEDRLFREQLLKEIKAALTDEQYQIIVMRYGFNCEPITLKAIGERLELTTYKVVHQEGKALWRLRKLRYFMDLKKELYEESEDNTIYYRSPNYGRGESALRVDDAAIKRVEKGAKIDDYIKEKLKELLDAAR